MKSVSMIKQALDNAIKETVEQHSDDKQFSRRRKLPLETIIPLLISAEGGSLAKILEPVKKSL